MRDELIDAVLDQASGDATLPEPAKLLVLAALEGPEDLDQMLADPSGAGSTTAATDGATDPADEPAGVTPAKAYLARITAEGFRGIGPRAEIALHPGPGLTVIAGRNGCGKSSFAEALEFALTQSSYRWAHKKAAVFSESWRNLHHGDPASVTVELAEEGAGLTTVAAEWASGAALGDSTGWTQRPGRKRGPLTDLGWDRDLELFRPFLSYDELGALFAEPSKLYDALAPTLGLERLEDARKLLSARVKEISYPAIEAARLGKQVLLVLKASSDPRAGSVVALMNGKPPNLAAIESLVTGTAPPDSTLTVLRTLAEIATPDLAGWRVAREAFAAAGNRRTAALAAAGTAALASASLLRKAVEYHSQVGDCPCPVCGQGELNTEWQQRARETLGEVSAVSQAVDDADAELSAARQALTRSVTPPPAVLGPDVGRQLVGIVDVSGTAVSWQALRAAASEPATPSGTVEALHQDLTRDVETLVTEAAASVTAREDEWRPLAVAVGEWLRSARDAAAAAENLTAIKAAEKWLKTNLSELRNARLAPLADKAREIWSALRQESNVDLGALTLEGTATRRRVELTASVDGEPAGAFAVMSQGELHALSLALFLPRATVEESPFGFLVIDDPVQAMDPAKVDGLAQVLANAADDRQIIVLTHDDRLPDAVRRLQIPARILEVTREADSAVSVREVDNPAKRYLSDARAVAADRAITPDIAARVIPTLCRMALEATCRDTHYRNHLGRGRSRADVEAQWSAATTTGLRVALAVHGSASASLDAWLRIPRRKAALGICASAPHRGLSGDASSAISDVESVVAELASSHAV